MNRERQKRETPSSNYSPFDVQPVKGSTSRGRSYGTIGARTAGKDARAERIRQAHQLARTNQVPLFGGGQLGRLARQVRDLLEAQQAEAKAEPQA